MLIIRATSLRVISILENVINAINWHMDGDRDL